MLFGSEIKAILADPTVDREIAPDIIDRFLTFLYVPGEETLLKGYQEAGSGALSVVKDGRAEIRQYWDLQFRSPTDSQLKEAKGQLLSLLAEVVDHHMIADVPVGVLLSGGVDSTAVLSFAVEKDRQSDQQLHGRFLPIRRLPTRDPMRGWRPKPSVAGITR